VTNGLTLGRTEDGLANVGADRRTDGQTGGRIGRRRGRREDRPGLGVVMIWDQDILLLKPLTIVAKMSWKNLLVFLALQLFLFYN
jgi:hypothetical protein